MYKKSTKIKSYSDYLRTNLTKITNNNRMCFG